MDKEIMIYIYTHTHLYMKVYYSIIKEYSIKFSEANQYQGDKSLCYYNYMYEIHKTYLLYIIKSFKRPVYWGEGKVDKA